jgi:hypothetical protein
MAFDDKADFGSVMPILSVSVRWGRVIGRGLQAGGRGFESRTLHDEKWLICRPFLRGSVGADNGGASAVRADLSGWSRARSVEVELSGGVW